MSKTWRSGVKFKALNGHINAIHFFVDSILQDKNIWKQMDRGDFRSLIRKTIRKNKNKEFINGDCRDGVVPLSFVGVY